MGEHGPPATIRSAFDPSLLVQAPADPLYSIVTAYEADQSDLKVDLGVGAYRDDSARPWILPVIKKAKEMYRQNPDINHEYLPIAGLPEFTSAAQKLILGADSAAIRDSRVCTLQTISGTGAVYLGGALLAKLLPQPLPSVHISTPSWPVYDSVLSTAGLPVRTYPCFDPASRKLDWSGMLASIAAAPPGSVIILQACAHNPTGCDPSEEQWRALAGVMKERGLFPFFDSAYQGFATGELARDSFSIRLFVEHGFEMLVAQSFAKNMGLYGERVGALHYIAPPDPDPNPTLPSLTSIPTTSRTNASISASSTTQIVASHLSILQRAHLSSPPIYGAMLVSLVLNTPSLYTEWEADLRTMSSRIIEMRGALREMLETLGTPPGDWSHVTQQIGMFCFTGLGTWEVRELRDKWHVYMAETGRISVAGLNWGNVAHVARAIDTVVRAKAERWVESKT